MGPGFPQVLGCPVTPWPVPFAVTPLTAAGTRPVSPGMSCEEEAQGCPPKFVWMILDYSGSLGFLSPRLAGQWRCDLGLAVHKCSGFSDLIKCGSACLKEGDSQQETGGG